MSQKLIKAIYVAADDPNQPDLDDIIFIVFEEYGEGFMEWCSRAKNYYYDFDIDHLTWPEVIQEYRKYVSQQNMNP